MNEWYAKDMSRKMRSTLKIKSSQGYAIGHPPYGYKYDEIDKKRWAIDEEAADVVRHGLVAKIVKAYEEKSKKEYGDE